MAAVEKRVRTLERRQLCRDLRQKLTPAEEKLWELLRGHRFSSLKFRRQHPIGQFVADFYCPEHKLAIELDGGVHKQSRERDEARDAAIRQHGVRVTRIPNNQVLHQPEAVLEILWRSLTPGPSPPTFVERGSPRPAGRGEAVAVVREAEGHRGIRGR